jgi:hypothetical protein
MTNVINDRDAISKVILPNEHQRKQPGHAFKAYVDVPTEAECNAAVAALHGVSLHLEAIWCCRRRRKTRIRFQSVPDSTSADFLTIHNIGETLLLALLIHLEHCLSVACGSNWSVHAFWFRYW